MYSIPSICLSLSLLLSVCLFTSLSQNLSISALISLSVCLLFFTYLSFSLFFQQITLCIHLQINLFLDPSTYIHHLIHIYLYTCLWFVFLNIIHLSLLMYMYEYSIWSFIWLPIYFVPIKFRITINNRNIVFHSAIMMESIVT